MTISEQPESIQDLIRVGHSTNLVGIPTGVLASTTFNDYPRQLRISGTREANYGLFRQLDTAKDAAEAAEIFQDYMYVLFGLNGDPRWHKTTEGEARESASPEGPRRFRSSYRKLLGGWGFDSNNPQAAVMKGWVESRFGLFPTFHREPLVRFNSPEWMGYVEQKMSSRFHNNSINLQLDLLFEFCQWNLARFHADVGSHMTLYRGENRFDEQRKIGPKEGRWMTVRMNNLVSFTANRNTACEFGDFILEVQVPIVKIFYCNELLPHSPLRGEWEYLVLGGEFRVKASYL